MENIELEILWLYFWGIIRNKQKSSIACHFYSARYVSLQLARILSFMSLWVKLKKKKNHIYFDRLLIPVLEPGMLNILVSV